MKCFLCDSSDLALRHRLPSKKIYVCPHDGLYLARETGTRRDDRLYDSSYYDNYPYSTALHLNKGYFTSKLATIRRLTGKSKPKILDVGCGWGDFLEVLKQEQIPYLGIDVSDEAIKLCNNKRLRCQKVAIQTLAKNQVDRWDAITSFQTIEHVANPLPFLKAAYTLLKPDGIILLTTPNHNTPLRKIFGSRWSVYNIESHFVFYNKKTLKTVLKHAGFSDAKVGIDRPRFFSLRYIIARLFTKELYSKFYILNSTIGQFPLPTDPWGDLAAVAIKS